MNNSDLNIVFMNRIGLNSDGAYEFDVYFSTTPEEVWAEDWSEQVPSICGMEEMLPDASTYEAIMRVSVDKRTKVFLAVENSCFSIQDCMDGILQLVWLKGTDGNYYGLDYGTDIDNAISFFKAHGFNVGQLRIVNADRDNTQGQDNDDEEDGPAQEPDEFVLL